MDKFNVLKCFCTAADTLQFHETARTDSFGLYSGISASVNTVIRLFSISTKNVEVSAPEFCPPRRSVASHCPDAV